MHAPCRVAAAAAVGLALTLAAGCTGVTPEATSSAGPVALGSLPGTAAPPVSAPSPVPAPTLVVTPLPVKLPTPVSRLVALGAGDRLLLLGGLGSSTTTANVLLFSPGTGTVSVVAHLAQATHDAGGAVLGGRAVVIGGGITASTTEAQTVALSGGAVSISGHLPQPRSDHAVAADPTTAYVVGGYTGSAELTDVLATTDGATFRVVAKLAETVRYPAAVVAGSVLWVFGGEHQGAVTDDIQRIDLTTGAASIAGHLPARLSHAAATVVDGTILVMGGTDGRAHQGTVYRFDPATTSVAAVGALPAPTSDMAVAVLADGAYVVGGETADARGKVTTLDTIVRLQLSH